MSMSTGLSGLNAATTDINTIANNVANVNTTGFKGSRAEFGDLVDSSGGQKPGLGVQTQAINQLFGDGAPRVTGHANSDNLDMRINSNGFFVVKDSGGTYYTRDGSFHCDKDGKIVNNLGQVLQGGTPPTTTDLMFDPTKLPVNGISIDPLTGEVVGIGSDKVKITAGALALVNFPNPQGLDQVSNTEWAETTASGTAIPVAATVVSSVVQTGQLESSNVDLTAQLVNMIIAQRNFSANAKTITTNNEMAQVVINMR